MNQNTSQPSANGRVLSRFLALWQGFLDRVWLQPDDSGPFYWRLLRPFLRVVLIVGREFQQDRIPLRASALTFTVVFSMVPLLALSTAVLKGLGADGMMRQAAYRYIDSLESGTGSPQQAEGVVRPDPESLEAAPPPIDASRQDEDIPLDSSLTEHLRSAVDKIFSYVDQVNFARLGAFGLIGVLLTAISVLATIEQAMNAIWKVPSNRPFGRKLIDYLALMVLLPLAVLVGLTGATTLQSPALEGYFQLILPAAWARHLLLNAVPVTGIVLTFMLLYRFLPNTQVRILPALASALVGGAGWLAVQLLYVKAQIGVARYNAIYGSFATLPLLLLWIHFAWTVFLVGAEVTYAAQSWRGYIWPRRPLTPLARLTLTFDIVALVFENFRHRQATDRSELARQLGQPDALISDILDELTKAGILHVLQDQPEGYAPAAPEEEIQAEELVSLVFGDTVPDLPAGPLALRVLTGARLAVEGCRFPQLLEDNGCGGEAPNRNAASGSEVDETGQPVPLSEQAEEK